jgi:hypothetical protein
LFRPRRFILLALLVPALASCATATGSSNTAESDADLSGTIDAAAAGSIDANQDPGGPDAATCSSAPCSILPQCGCQGQVCDLDPENLASAGTACRDVSSPGDETSACSALTGCAGGYVCLGGQCRVYCDDDNPCGDGAHCILQPSYEVSAGMYETVPDVFTCTKSCSPDLPTANGCPSSPDQFGCHLRRADPDGVADSGDEFFHSDCLTSEGRGNDADCSDLGDAACAPGYECVSLNATSVCKQLCTVPGGICAGGLTCTAFVDPKPVIGGIEYGVCL